MEPLFKDGEGYDMVALRVSAATGWNWMTEARAIASELEKLAEEMRARIVDLDADDRTPARATRSMEAWAARLSPPRPQKGDTE